MDTQIAYGLLSLIQDRAAAVLERDENETRRFTALTVAGSLLEQLRDSRKALPDGLALDLGGLVDQLDVLNLVADGDTTALRGRLHDAVGSLAKSLVDGDGLPAARAAVERLIAGSASSGTGSPPVLSLLRRQLGIGISFATTLKNLANLDLAREIPEGWKAYFFGDNGFETIDGIAIVAPGHSRDLLARIDLSQVRLENLGATVRELKGAFKERSGEQYVRDLIRITAEVAGDRRYRLRARYPAMLEAVTDRDKAARWFRGVGSMAESLVTGAVEEACLGVAQFQTNPILAASAATYAGTVARKATQHVFLAELAM
ncbi:MAG: hypothetical protein ACREKH_16365 [Candidatus Rokuibacteriota bacterium]